MERNNLQNQQTTKNGDLIAGKIAKASTIDTANLISSKIPSQVRDEVPTLNQFGYMKSELEYFGNSFLARAKNAEKPVLEIGPAYGWLTHRALETGATIIASDISKEHLEILVKNTPKEYLNKLYLYLGAFPNEVDFESASLDTVMMARIMHFLDGENLEKGLAKVHDWLVPDGQLIATNCSIYHSSVKEKMSKIFQERISSNKKWAGMATRADFDSVHDDYSADFLNTFYKEQLEELLPKYGFKIETLEYFDYPSDPWPDEGKGHIGFVATKV